MYIKLRADQDCPCISKALNCFQCVAVLLPGVIVLMISLEILHNPNKCSKNSCNFDQGKELFLDISLPIEIPNKIADIFVKIELYV